jgi:hypothetical protein
LKNEGRRSKRKRKKRERKKRWWVVGRGGRGHWRKDKEN